MQVAVVSWWKQDEKQSARQSATTKSIGRKKNVKKKKIINA